MWIMSIPRPNAVTYEGQLQTVQDQLAPTAEEAGIKGTGIARFAWAKKGSRSVGISWSDEGIFVEFWEKPAKDDERESFYKSYEEATEAARKWLAGE
jgi:hypothetical protein